MTCKTSKKLVDLSSVWKEGRRYNGNIFLITQNHWHPHKIYHSWKKHSVLDLYRNIYPCNLWYLNNKTMIRRVIIKSACPTSFTVTVASPAKTVSFIYIFICLASALPECHANAQHALGARSRSVAYFKHHRPKFKPVLWKKPQCYSPQHLVNKYYYWI